MWQVACGRNAAQTCLKPSGRRVVGPPQPGQNLSRGLGFRYEGFEVCYLCVSCHCNMATPLHNASVSPSSAEHAALPRFGFVYRYRDRSSVYLSTSPALCGHRRMCAESLGKVLHFLYVEEKGRVPGDASDSTRAQAASACASLQKTLGVYGLQF